jgi:hypothetical protein
MKHRSVQVKRKEKSVPTAEGGFSGERVRRLRADSEIKKVNLAERRRKLVGIHHRHGAERLGTEGPR